MAEAPWSNRIVRYGMETPEQLLANPRNFRIHPKAQQDALSGALSDIGWISPVIVNETTGHVIDGHLRIGLAISKQEKSVPVVYVALNAVEEAEALLTFDPIGAMAVADKEQLAGLLADVQSGEAGVQAMLAELARENGLYVDPVVDAPESQIDRAEELRVKWGVETGQLWQVGRHRLLCGDATKAEDIERLMEGQRADIVVTDPPYGMNLDTDWSGAVGSMKSIGRQHQTKGRTYDRVVGDSEPFDPSGIFEHFGYCPEIFLWGADYYAESIPHRNEGSWLVWDKRKESQAEAIGSEFELCWSKGKHKRRMLRHDWFGFLSSSNGADARNRMHPTQKPTSVMVDIFRQWGNDGDIIVDVYLGSGTTACAAEQLGRTCYAMEIEPKYIAVSLQRLADMGLEPKLL